MTEKRLFFFVVIAFSLFTLVLFWPIFFGKVNLNGNLLVSFYTIFSQNLPYKDTGWDQLRIYFPFYKVTLDALRHLYLPFWNPYAFSGHPHIADFQTAVFYPLNILGLIVPQITFWHILRITPTIFASFFTFFYLRNLKLDSIAAFFGALVFGFSPFIITWGEEVVMSPHSIVYLSPILLAIDKLRNKYSRFYFFILVISVCLSLFAGYLQTTIYLLILAFFYLVYRGVILKLNFKFYIRTFSGILLGVIISSLQLLPSIELFLNSQRSSVDFSSIAKDYLMPPVSLITFLAPDFFGNPATRNYFLSTGAHYYEAILYIGIAPALFSVYIVLKKRDPTIIFFAVSTLVSLAVVINSFFSRFFVSMPIPLLSTAIVNRILFVPAFSIAVLSAIGFDYWLKTKKSGLVKTIVLFIFLYALVFLYVAYKAGYFTSGVSFAPEIIVSLRNLVIPFTVFVFIVFALTFVKNKKHAAILIILITSLNIFYFANKYLSFSDKQYIFPEDGVLQFIINNQGLYRTLFVGDRTFSNNFATQYSIFYPEGYDSLNNRDYANFIFAVQKLPQDYVALRRSDAELGFRDNLNEAFANKDKRGLLDVLGIKYLAAEGEDRNTISEYDGFLKVFEREKVAVFENKTVLPRAFLASNWQSASRDDVFLSGEVEIVSYAPSKVLITTTTWESKFLVLTDNFYNSWKVKVDGEPAEILRSYSTFRAVKVSPGQHEIEFYYESNIFKWGIILSLVGVFILIVVSYKKDGFL